MTRERLSAILTTAAGAVGVAANLYDAPTNLTFGTAVFGFMLGAGVTQLFPAMWRPWRWRRPRER